MGKISRNFGTFGRRILFFAATLVAVSATLLSPGCGREGYVSNEGMVWHTTYHITYRGPENLADSVLRVLNDVGASLNVFDPNSLTAIVNAGDSVPVDAHFKKVFETSVRVNALSNGAFDPTLGPLITAWGFGKGHQATADTLRIDSLMAFTGIGKTRLEGDLLVKDDRRTEFNFSAIAKGYGCDCVAEMLQRNGVKDFLVEIGGEIRCGGAGPQGGDWRVSIDKPIRTDSLRHDSQCIIALTDRGMATSGNYRNFHGSGENAYGHTISAKTGRPAKTDVLSATVIAPTAMEADALATAMMAAGSSEARRMAEQLKLPVMLVLNDMSVWETPEFTALLLP